MLCAPRYTAAEQVGDTADGCEMPCRDEAQPVLMQAKRARFRRVQGKVTRVGFPERNPDSARSVRRAKVARFATAVPFSLVKDGRDGVADGASARFRLVELASRRSRRGRSAREVAVPVGEIARRRRVGRSGSAFKSPCAVDRLAFKLSLPERVQGVLDVVRGSKQEPPVRPSSAKKSAYLAGKQD